MSTPYIIPNNFPQPSGYDSDGSPFWDIEGCRWINRNWIVPLERLAEYVIPLQNDIQTDLIPTTIGPAQLRVALYVLHGITPEALDTIIETVISSLPIEQQITANMLWKYSTIINRNNSLTIAVSQVLNLTNEQIDEIFLYGNTI